MASAKRASWPRVYAHKISIIHFAYVAVHFITIVIFDSWNLLTPNAVKQRWTLIGFVAICNAALFYASRLQNMRQISYRLIIFSFIVLDLAIAALFVYWERGMASLSVMLFVVPLIIAAGERSRGFIMSTAVVAAAIYSTTIVRYFNESPSEGFRVQLYGTAFLYSSLFLVLAALLIVVLKVPKKEP